MSLLANGLELWRTFCYGQQNDATSNLLCWVLNKEETMENFTRIEEMIGKNVEFKDLLGIHTGVINEVRITDRGVKYYVISFGQNVWLNGKDFRKTWWLQEKNPT